MPRKTSTLKLVPKPKVITFDCYGTLVDWYGVLTREIEVTPKAHGRDALPKKFRAGYAFANVRVLRPAPAAHPRRIRFCRKTIRTRSLRGRPR